MSLHNIFFSSFTHLWFSTIFPTYLIHFLLEKGQVSMLGNNHLWFLMLWDLLHNWEILGKYTDFLLMSRNFARHSQRVVRGGGGHPTTFLATKIFALFNGRVFKNSVRLSKAVRKYWWDGPPSGVSLITPLLTYEW